MTSPDIRERAERLLDDVLSNERHLLSPFSSADLISQALASEREAGRAEERERAATVADKKARDLKFNDLSARQHGRRLEAEGYAYASQRCEEIAAAIRNPET